MIINRCSAAIKALFVTSILGLTSFAAQLTTQWAGPGAASQDVVFSKTRFSSVKQPRETEVILTVTGSGILIRNKKADKKQPAIDLQIPYVSIDSMSYELAARHRIAEGAAVMGASLGVGAVLMATKTKSHWLAVEYHEGSGQQMTLLRLDKSEFQGVLTALETRTGKSIPKLDTATAAFNPTANSKDMDETIPFRVEKVVTALKPAMESMGCKVTAETAGRIECKRSRGSSEQTGGGGESVTATLEATGQQTHLRIWTGKGFVGRVQKKNWSTPIYQAMLKTLQNELASP